MKLQAEWRDRLKYWIHTLTQDFYIPLKNIDFDGFCTYEQLTVETALKQSFTPIREGDGWGEEWQYAWFRSQIVLPPQAAGQQIVMDLRPGGEAAIFVDEKAFGTRRAEWVTVPHHYVQDNILCESGEAGRTYNLLLEAYAGHYYPNYTDVSVGPVLPGTYESPLQNTTRAIVGRSTFGIWNEDAYQLWLDVVTLTEVMENLSDGSLRAAKIAKGLKDFTLAVDFEQPHEKRLRDYAKGREILCPLMDAKNGSTAPTFYGIGNAHLDVVWLWPYQETVRKTARTFAQQLRLLEQNPDYVFLQSQPQTYQMCKENYPELYERIKQAVRDGRWIVEGGMWVEPDTNMSSGESLIRQLIYGLRFFREEFGVTCEILWLPDTFGYSAVLPQILKDFGIKYLVTQKIFWSYNEGEQFPYHYFAWQGNDGSEVISYLPTDYTYKTNPAVLMQTWENRVQKDEMDKFLLPFGYGDGGGGPTRDYIEFARRQADLECAPKVKMAHPGELFRDLAADGGPTHKYVGELYFTAHRGVYTSQAGVKKGNRKSELALREAELWASVAEVRDQGAYPRKELEAAWKKVLLNQFHDILPGSSIARVYKEAAVLHCEAIHTCTDIAEKNARAIAGAGGNISVFNSLSWARTVSVELPARFAGGAKTMEGQAVAVEHVNGKVLAHVTVPSCGFVVLIAEKSSVTVENGATAVVTADGAVLENAKVRAVFNCCGEMISFTLKDTGRETAAAPMNRFLLYKDVPRAYDAWDIDSMYEQQLVDLDASAKISLVSVGRIRAAIRIEKTIGHSKLSQVVSLCADGSRLEFDTTVDWRELHRLLKVSFPVDVYATEAINEIQFGYVKRPTHRSRQYEKDRFEVCNHRYTALCDEAHGAAVLNDCKYGVSMTDNAINLTLLRAAASPEMRADNGIQQFTYAFTAWEGQFTQSDVVRQGYELNVPVTVIDGGSESESFFSTSKQNVIIEAVKMAEDRSGDLIVRLYESMRADTHAQIRCGFPIHTAWLCRMDESVIEELSVNDGNVDIHFRPFQIVTLRVKTKK